MATGYSSPVGGGLASGSAPVNFLSAAPDGQVDSNVVVEWDFDNDGDFDGTHEDITGYVMSAETMSGRDWPSNLQGQATAGQLRLTLLNDDDRFSYFNAGSPLNQDGNSLRTGRKIRVRTAESAPSDPVLLARDHFNRADGTLAGSSDELGNVWSTLTGGGYRIVNGRAQQDVQLQTTLATVPVAVGSQYVQARVMRSGAFNSAGVVARAQNANNYVAARLVSAPEVQLIEVVAGVLTVLASFALVQYPGIIIGLHIDDSDVATVYVNGSPVISDTVSLSTAAGVGLRTFWSDAQVQPPVMDDFYCWTSPVPTVPGVIWTGDVTEVTTAVPVGGLKVAEVTATGTLTRAAAAQVPAPRAVAGARTGLLVGDVFTRADVLLPPSATGIDPGSVTTGPVYIDDADALTLARRFEATELGFIHETPEGPPGYQDRAARDLAASSGWWSDTPGVGQYPYSTIVPLDFKREVVNRVTAQVAASAPAGITLESNILDVTTPGVRNDVTITMPDVAKGDLVVVFIASAVATSGQNWLTPIWWVNHREAGSDIRMRVYDHICDGTEGGTTVTFYADTPNAGGGWIAHVYRIPDWYLNGQGVAFAPPQPGRTPTPITPDWGKQPTLYIAAFASMTSLAGITGTPVGPAGYEDHDAFNVSGAPAGGEVGLCTAWKVDIGGPETPSAFTGQTGALIEEACTYAVRGFNGPFTDPLSIEHPEVSGGDGRPVTLNDIPSQIDHNAVVTLANPGDQFATIGDAELYTRLVLDRYADDRPIISLSFFATSRAEMREQAFTRRLGDRITVTATGDTGLGFQRDFFIEAIGHVWSNAAKLWEVTWQLSPA